MIEIPSSTISDWVFQGSDLIAPLFEVLKNKLLEINYLQADESPIKVLDQNKESKMLI